jgi:hypothetical protein
MKIVPLAVLTKPAIKKAEPSSLVAEAHIPLAVTQFE